MLDEDNALRVSTDYGVESSDPYSISGKFVGELKYKSPEETFKHLKEVTQDAGLLGKTYGVNDYICTTFGKDVVNLLGLDEKQYYPSGNLVKDNLEELIKNDSVFELGKTDKLDAGVYVFYKVYDNDYNGHTGFIYIDKEQNQTILHNGYNPSGVDSVNEFSRGNSNFNKFFKTNPKNPVYLKQIFILEDE